MVAERIEEAVIRVLVVDDEESVRGSISRVLGFHGYSVQSVGGVVEALDKIEHESFDVVLTDLRMRGPEDGLTVIEAVRKANPQTVTLLMSAYTNLTGPATRLSLRSDEIVSKPMDISTLLRRMQESLASARESLD